MLHIAGKVSLSPIAVFGTMRPMAVPREPKKTSTIYARVPEELKNEFKDSLDALGIQESFFVRAVAEGLIHLVKNGESLVLPVRLHSAKKKQIIPKGK